jgi:Tn3 transposase DDE domain
VQSQTGLYLVTRIVSPLGPLRVCYAWRDRSSLGGLLNLVTNAVVLWNTVYMSAVLDQLRTEGHNVDERGNSGGARCNPPETPAIYTSLERESALAEAD